ncbi:MAG: dihydroorotate dehydrogenase [Gemmatimonadetes bacterium]|nr:dihydroorotate dehydrogenase [Gemmatimonadota bacterium]
MTAGVRPAPIALFGTTFQNPILLAAGTAGFGRELAATVDLEALGGLVSKAVSVEPRPGNRSPRVAEFDGGMLNSIGLANPGLAQVARDELPWMAANLRRPRILVNVVGFAEDEYLRVIEGLEPVGGMVGYELNLSCPNTSAGGIEFGADAGAIRRIVSRCRAATRRALLAKLSPALPDIPGLAAAAVDAGADGISVVNTMPGLVYEGDHPRLGNGNGGVSGPALLPVGLLATARVRRHLPSVPIIGVGGVRSLEHVRQYLASGANLVAIGTAGLADPRLPERLARAWEAGG